MNYIQKVRNTLQPVLKPVEKVHKILFTPTRVKILVLLVGLGFFVLAIMEVIGVIILFFRQFGWDSVVNVIFAVGYVICYVCGGVAAILSSFSFKKVKRDQYCSIVFLVAVVLVIILYVTETTLSLATSSTSGVVDEEYDKLDTEVKEAVSKGAILGISISTSLLIICCSLIYCCCYFCVATLNLMNLKKSEKPDDEAKKTSKYRVLENEVEGEGELMDDDLENADDGLDARDVMEDDMELPDLNDEGFDNDEIKVDETPGEEIDNQREELLNEKEEDIL